jgi:hypothetical protein
LVRTLRGSGALRGLSLSGALTPTREPQIVALSVTRTSFALMIACALIACTQPASAGNANGWCAELVRLNTKYGTMRNKRYLLRSQVSLSAWKRLIDATLAERRHYIALAPTSIKTAVKHRITWYAKVKANHYSRTTSYPPLTRVDTRKLIVFESTHCGVTYAGDWPLPPS